MSPKALLNLHLAFSIRLLFNNLDFFQMWVLYAASLIRSIIALHNLINNKLTNKEAEKKEATGKKEDKEKKDEKEKEKAEDKNKKSKK